MCLDLNLTMFYLPTVPGQSLTHCLQRRVTLIFDYFLVELSPFTSGGAKVRVI